MKKINIAIDGYSSCGKSTLAKQIASITDYLYVDTGAMYRAVTLFALRIGAVGTEFLDEKLLQKSISDLHIVLQFDPETKQSVPFINGENVSEEIRNMDVSNTVSRVSELGFVREKLVDLQRKMAETKGVVMDGRDIGTVVMPFAELKLFMTADMQVRAERRFNELLAAGKQISFNDVLNNIKQRDEIDVNRKIAPLLQAEDAIIVDNTHLTPEEQLTYAIGLVNNMVVEQA